MERTQTQKTATERRLIATISTKAPDQFERLSTLLLQLQFQYERLLDLEFQKSKAVLVKNSKTIQEICTNQEKYTRELNALENMKDEMLSEWGLKSKNLTEVLEELSLAPKDKIKLLDMKFYLNTLITDLEGRMRTNTIMLEDIQSAYKLSVSSFTEESTLSYNKTGKKEYISNRQLVSLTA